MADLAQPYPHCPTQGGCSLPSLGAPTLAELEVGGLTALGGAGAGYRKPFSPFSANESWIDPQASLQMSLLPGSPP